MGIGHFGPFGLRLRSRFWAAGGGGVHAIRKRGFRQASRGSAAVRDTIDFVRNRVETALTRVRVMCQSASMFQAWVSVVPAVSNAQPANLGLPLHVGSNGGGPDGAQCVDSSSGYTDCMVQNDERPQLGDVAKSCLLLAVVVEGIAAYFLVTMATCLVHDLRSNSGNHERGIGVVLSLAYGIPACLAAAILLMPAKRHLPKPWDRLVGLPIWAMTFVFLLGMAILNLAAWF